VVTDGDAVEDEVRLEAWASAPLFSSRVRLEYEEWRTKCATLDEWQLKGPSLDGKAAAGIRESGGVEKNMLETKLCTMMCSEKQGGRVALLMPFADQLDLNVAFHHFKTCMRSLSFRLSDPIALNVHTTVKTIPANMSWAAIAGTAPPPAAPVEVPAESKPRVAVIDANAIIQGVGLLDLLRVADRVVTIPEVLREVRDKQSRSLLESLPFNIEIQEPSDDSVKAGTSTFLSHPMLNLKIIICMVIPNKGMITPNASLEHPLAVVKFARATGDLHALSSVDTKLLALAYTIESSYYGTSHLRDLPPPPKVSKKRAVDAKALPGWGAQGGAWEELDKLNEEELAAAEAALLAGGHRIDIENDGDNDAATKMTSRIAAQVQTLSLEAADVAENAHEIRPETQANAGGDVHGEAHRELNEASDNDDDGDEDSLNSDADDDDDSSGWEVAAKNRNKARRAKRKAYRRAEREAEAVSAVQHEEEKEEMEGRNGLGDGSDEDVYQGEDGSDDDDDSDDDRDDEEEDTNQHRNESEVCCITADFAMQNVLLQMGLRLSTPDGRRISTVTRWALRCTACFQVTKEVGRLFCPRCGNATLDKVRVTVGPDGAEQYGVKKKHVLRGTKFPLPKPRGGRSRELILREDQLLSKQHLLRAQRKKEAQAAAALDPFAPEYGEETWHQASALPQGGMGAQALLAGWKRNPNERKHVATNRRRK
jgi:RNA-binding protein NOB1